MRTATFPSFAPLSQPAEADAAVIGSGIAGLSAAWELARAGLSVIVLEADRLASGVTGHTTGKLTALHTSVYDTLRSEHGEEAARDYADSQSAALGHVLDVAGQLGVDCELRGAHGVLGTLVLGWDSPHSVDVAERAVLTTIAAYTAQALERAVHLDERVTVAHELQQAMLTDLPAATGLELAALYRPAAQDDTVGGDWYDAYHLPAAPGERTTAALAITVGDITGHDMKAAALMGQVRSMLRQADHDHPGMGPDRVLSALEAACRRLDIPASGTLVHAHLNPADNGRWRLTWTNAGHLPPLLATPDGTAQQLTPHGPLMHPFLPPGPRSSHSRLLPPGSILLLYTDGLVETRHGDIEENIERLARLLTAAPADIPLDTLLRALHDTAAPAQAEDDTVLLAVRLPAQG
ncbi:PP2C family protein-serine/threonine phosphatase [Streptomyces sp. NPDC088707]|uniref:PP2C family protein-serine/threonine phosphatase n=1 Tax=Streptomyces sp. NPDC088707 TaxID=3365871 RepID=UPI003816B922